MVTDLVQDWETIPFTSIKVQSDNCDYTTKSVFTRVWGGTEDGCLVENTLFWNSNKYIETYE